MKVFQWVGGAVLGFTLVGCGYPPPREVRPGEYQLYFCEQESQCYEAAEKACPNGYRVKKFEASRPEIIVCGGGTG